MRLQADPVHLGLYGVCGVLTIALFYQLLAPLPVDDLPKISLRRPSIADIALMPPPAPSSNVYGDIDARPLFSSLRKPAPKPPPAPAAPPPPPSASLIGVIIDGESRLALVKTPASPFAQSLKVGTTLDGWQIAEIDPDKIVLHSATFDYEIRLDANRPSQQGQEGPSERMGPPMRPGPQGQPAMQPGNAPPQTGSQQQ